MTRRNPTARYTLPEVPQPDAFRCYQISVPDDPMHIAAFQGQIMALSRAYVWANDDDHTALLAAEAWRPIFDNLCLSPDPCVGVPTILCISGSFTDDSYGFVPAIGTACSPAYVPGVGWQSCHNTTDDKEQIQLIRPFTSSTYLRHAKFRFVSETPSVPYTLSVDFYQSGVSVFHYDEFVPFGGGVTFDQDINQQVDLVLVQQLGEVGGTGLLTLTDFELCYTGDFPLSQPPSVWTSTFDFTVSLYGLTLNYGVWTSGVGIVGDAHFGRDMVAGFDITPASAVHLTSAIMVYSMIGAGGTDNSVRLGFVIGGTFDPMYFITSGTDAASRSFGGPVNADVTLINCTVNTGNLTGSNVIQTLVLTGTGTKPSSFP